MWDWLISWFNTFLGWVQAAYNWLADLVIFVLTQIWIWIMDAAALMLSNIPAPYFIEDLTFANIPPVVLFFAEPFRPGYGIGVVLVAYATRFVIRRIPVIG